jgi:transcriptional regulator with XRE-family HTH domain
MAMARGMLLPMRTMSVDSKTVLKLLGAEVRRRREALNLSQAMLAHRARVHTNVIGRIERGSYNPTVLTLGAIAAALNASLVEILAQREPNKRAKLRAV